MKQLAIIRFWYEGNAFSPITATKDAFKAREWISGIAAKEFYRNTNVEVAAVEPFMTTNSEIEAHYIFCAAAYPAGPMQKGLFGEILSHIEKGLTDHLWDGVYLSLHGSAVSSDEPQVETRLVTRVREIVGAKVPVAISLDLHANINPQLASLANIICGYKTYPHVDMFDTAAKALSLLGKAMSDEIMPVTTVVPAGFAPTSFNMITGQNPMAEIMIRAEQLELEKNFHDVSVFGGFVYADTIDTGASITICSEADSTTDASSLASIFRSKAPQFDGKLPSATEVLSDITELLNQATLIHPVAILEPSDNLFSGGGADTPGLLKAVLESDIKQPALFAFFWDPDIVQLAIGIGIDGELNCNIGGRLTSEFGLPIEMKAQVEKLTDGKFVNQGPMEKNLVVNLGPTAVLRMDNLFVIVTSNNIPVNDRAYFDLHGLNLDDFPIVYVKAKNHFRSAFENQFSQIILVETPGPAASDLTAFNFKNIPDNRLNMKINIRNADVNDAEAIAAIHTASWRDVYRNILPKTYLTDEIESERSCFWRDKLEHLPDNEMVLTINSGTVGLGFIWITDQGEPEYDAVIEALHIDGNNKGCGYGKKLMNVAVARLIDDGQKSVCLRVFDENLPAIKFYQHIGGIKDQSGIDNFSGANAPDSRIGWKDINQLLAVLG